MLVSYPEIEKMTDLFTLGAYFLFMVYGSSMLFTHSRYHMHRVSGWVLAWWAFLVFDGYIGYLFPYGSEISEQYDRIANVLDMTVVVGVVMIGYALTYTRKVSLALLSLHSIPYVIFLSAVIFTQSDNWMMVAFVWTIIYSIAYFAFFMLQVRSYMTRVHAVYSDDTSRNLNWLKSLLWVFFSMLIVWAIPTYLHIVGTYIIFYVSSIALWWVAVNKLLKQKPVNIRYFAGSDSEGDENDEEATSLEAAQEPMAPSDNIPEGVVTFGNEVLDRRFSFAPRLHEMFEVEHVYLQSDLNINDLARVLGTNRAYLSAYLNNVKNISFFDYVNSWRLKKAVQMLSSNMDTVDVVADACGFNNTYSFRRVFSKTFECTPTEWRHLTDEQREEKMKLLN